MVVPYERGAEVRNAYLLRCMLSNGEQVRRAAMNEKQRFTIGDGITNVAIY